MDVTVEIRRASARFTERMPGRATQHSFSFGDQHDPERLRFGPMVCHDDHFLKAGEGFATHPHSGVSIVTWVLDGALSHDGVGDAVVVAPGQVAVLQTGDGVTHPPVEHSEVAAEPRTRFVQVWLAADEPAPPSYDVTAVTLEPGILTEVATPLPGARFSVARLRTGDTVELPAAGRVHAFVATGALTRSSLAEPLSAGDAFELIDHPAVRVTAAVPTELLVWSFD